MCKLILGSLALTLYCDIFEIATLQQFVMMFVGG